MNAQGTDAHRTGKASGAKRRTVHMPPSWSAEKKAKFEAWLNDELTSDEEAKLLCVGKYGRAQAIEARRAETENTGSVADESAVPQGCAQTAPKGAR